MTWAPGSSADRALITLAAPVGSPSGRYISFGLSDDSKMVSAVLASWWIMLQWVDLVWDGGGGAGVGGAGLMGGGWRGREGGWVDGGF